MNNTLIEINKDPRIESASFVYLDQTNYVRIVLTNRNDNYFHDIPAVRVWEWIDEIGSMNAA